MMKFLNFVKNAPKEWKFFLWTGAGLCVLSVVVFAILFFKHDISYQLFDRPLLLLFLLYLLFIGYTGPIFLVIGVFLWSLVGGTWVKIIAQVFLTAVLFLFIPFATVCASTPRICNDIVFVWEPKYWNLVYDYSVNGANWDVHWHYFGWLYLEEGFGDVAKEISIVQDSI